MLAIGCLLGTSVQCSYFDPTPLLPPPPDIPLSQLPQPLPLRMSNRVVGETNSFKNGTCAICLEDYSSTDEINVLINCNHAFHKNCLLGWTRGGQTTCPLCRKSMMT